MDQFNGLFAREVLDVETEHQYTSKILVYLMLQARLVMRGMAEPQQTQCRKAIGIIVDNVDLAKGNDTLEMGRERLGMDLIPGNDTK